MVFVGLLSRWIDHRDTLAHGGWDFNGSAGRRRSALTDALELSSNQAERSIKPFVIDWKNFLFANTLGGVQSSAVIYSLIETAKENGLDSYRYLVHGLKTAPTLDQAKEDWVALLLHTNTPDDCCNSKRIN